MDVIIANSAMQQELDMIPLMLQRGFQPNGVGALPCSIHRSVCATTSAVLALHLKFDMVCAAPAAVVGADPGYEVLLRVHRRFAEQRERF